MPPVSTTLAKQVAKFAAGAGGDIGGKFATGVVDTGSKFALTCEYLHKFSNKFEMVLMGYFGAGGKPT